MNRPALLRGSLPFVTLVAAAAVLGCSACGSTATPAPFTATPGPAIGAPVAAPTPAPSAVSAEAASSLAAATNLFAMDLWQRTRLQEGNLAASPASITMALAMTYGGAGGETATEMANVLHFGMPAEEAHAAASSQLAAWNDPARETYELRVANRLFGERTYDFHAAYITMTGERYGAPLEALDFIGSAEAGRVHINGWVAGQTHDRIQNLIPSGALDTTTRLVLTNAIYFKGKWLIEFDEEQTQPAVFFGMTGQSANVPTMHMQKELRYAATEAVQILEMPYVGNELAMTIVLPTARDGITAVEESLTAAQYDQWIGALTEREVIVSLPRFKIDPAEPIALKPTLVDMGMPLAFDRNRADFSVMGGASDGSNGLYIDEVFHKAFVEVNEEGTEAAAATAVVMMERGMAQAEPPPAFRADHPFLFFIRDLRTGTILFMGRVAQPAA